MGEAGQAVIPDRIFIKMHILLLHDYLSTPGAPTVLRCDCSGCEFSVLRRARYTAIRSGTDVGPHNPAQRTS